MFQTGMRPGQLTGAPASHGVHLGRSLGAFRSNRPSRPVRRQRPACRASLEDDLGEVLDKVRVREAAMRQAAEAEDYKAAAAQRDALTQLQLQQRRLELEIDEEARTVHYDIGMVMRHRRYNYRGVIVGFDDHCSAHETWMRQMKIDNLPKGRRQPFYHVLVDTNDRPSSTGAYASTYVAQENIEIPKDAGPVTNELIEHNFERFENGRYLPKSHLVQQYPSAGHSGSGEEAGSGPGDEDKGFAPDA